jgi:hypothetical protein
MKQKQLFNDYVSVGISHRIASGLSGRMMSGLLTDEFRKAIVTKEEEKTEDKNPAEENKSKGLPANATKSESPTIK